MSTIFWILIIAGVMYLSARIRFHNFSEQWILLLAGIIFVFLLFYGIGSLIVFYVIPFGLGWMFYQNIANIVPLKK